jgi:hypothetical protein
VIAGNGDAGRMDLGEAGIGEISAFLMGMILVLIQLIKPCSAYLKNIKAREIKKRKI